MTITELIAKLQTFDGNLKVKVYLIEESIHIEPTVELAETWINGDAVFPNDRTVKETIVEIY